jgi:uncharacterized repeat protein (TIGR02543 family)
MHAQWQEAGTPPIKYTITFNTHGGSAVTAITEDEGTAVIKPTDPTRTGYTLAGWYSAESGGTPYTWPHTLNASVTMHARWTAIAYTVTYNANGGSGTTAASSHTYDTPKNLSANAFTRTGYSFGGWNTAAAGGGTSYGGGEVVSNLSSVDGAVVTLYATWTAGEPGDTGIAIEMVIHDDGEILVSNDDVTLSKSGAGGKPTSLMVQVTGAYSAVQWYLDGDPVPGGDTFTLNAANYGTGRYRLEVMVTKDGVPYSTGMYVTVEN